MSTTTRYHCGLVMQSDLRVVTLSILKGTTHKLIHPRLKRMARAIQWDTTDRQRQCMSLYYGRRMAQQDIAHLLGIDASTVSRNISAGMRHVHKALEIDQGVEA